MRYGFDSTKHFGAMKLDLMRSRWMEVKNSVECVLPTLVTRCIAASRISTTRVALRRLCWKAILIAVGESGLFHRVKLAITRCHTITAPCGRTTIRSSRWAFHATASVKKRVASLMDCHEASCHVEMNRLPELFCGFHRRPETSGPTLYPVACSPQAWAAGSVFMLVQACLGLTIDAPAKKIVFEKIGAAEWRRRDTSSTPPRWGKSD